MQKNEVPQDGGYLKVTREVCYAVDENGNYTKVLSDGWNPKTYALEQVWEQINENLQNLKQQVIDKKISPVAYYLEKNLMDLSVLSQYTGFGKWRIKRHFKPDIFKKLSNEKLEKYAEAFNITVEELKNII